MLIDEVGDACGACARNERLANYLNGLCLFGLEQAEWRVLRTGLASGQQYLGTAELEHEQAGGTPFQEVASLDWVHDSSPAATTAAVLLEIWPPIVGSSSQQIGGWRQPYESRERFYSMSTPPP
ncbi:MAG: hypothetical protein JO358_17900 [Alphaproteobacteria bacterium]|nr:hypothetical protein [Alphaproteobacteria bacterium]